MAGHGPRPDSRPSTYADELCRCRADDLTFLVKNFEKSRRRWPLEPCRVRQRQARQRECRPTGFSCQVSQKECDFDFSDYSQSFDQRRVS
jgi:hypothetical protein